MNEQTLVSKIFYQNLRKVTGCPKIIAVKTPFGYYVETEDGSCFIESITDVGNIWEAKSRCVKTWLKKFKRLGKVEK